MPRLIFLACLTMGLGILVVASAGAATPSVSGGGVARGGVGVPGNPAVLDVVCLTRCVSGHKATPGATVTIKGGWLATVRTVVFRGRSGPIRSRPVARDPRRVRAVVPQGALASRPFVINAAGKRSNRSPHTLEVLPPSAIPKTVFPIRGPHSYGGPEGRFGAPRSGHTHQGQDVLASCGETLVAVRRSRVRYNRWDDAAGNFLVLHNIGTNTDYVYMHMIRPSWAKPGTVLSAGQVVGFVGETGDAVGCHLHFELWVGPWYGGGHPIDPLPLLKRLDRKG